MNFRLKSVSANCRGAMVTRSKERWQDLTMKEDYLIAVLSTLATNCSTNPYWASSLFIVVHVWVSLSLLVGLWITFLHKYNTHMFENI